MKQLCLGAWLLILLAGGYGLPYLKNLATARVLAWTGTILTTVLAAWITADASPLYRMGVIVGLQLIAMKNIVLVETYPSRKPGLNVLQWTAFALGWFGMRPELFETFPGKAYPFRGLIIRGVSRIIIGVVLLYVAGRIGHSSVTTFFAAPLITLVALSLMLHMGVLNVSTGVWRMLGADVRELFRAPYKAMSLKEFWGRRWNLAFSEMTARIAYKPLKKRLGMPGATLVAFLLSGILHEIAISLPVNAGYGLPLLYFALHGALMLAEDKVLWVKRIVTHNILSHIWVLGWLVLPMPLLFHEPFMHGVIEPLRGLIVTAIPLAQ